MIFVSSISVAQQISYTKLSIQTPQKATIFSPVKDLRFYKIPAATNHSQPFLSPNFYASQLGFFCKQEIKLDKITKIPFRFRLGSVEECKRLETPSPEGVQGKCLKMESVF